MKRKLVERAIEDGHLSGGAPRPGRKGVTVNLHESPLGWLMSRGLLSDRQLAAGEQLRADYERAQLAPGITMRWDGVRSGGSSRSAPEPVDPAMAQISAKRRFDDAMAVIGPGLRDILWRVACAGEGVTGAERALGWPTRSGKLVLGFALDRLADHYRFR